MGNFPYRHDNIDVTFFRFGSLELPFLPYFSLQMENILTFQIIDLSISDSSSLTYFKNIYITNILDIRKFTVNINVDSIVSFR